MTAIFEKVEQYFLKKLPFVIYNKPNQEVITGIFQKDTTLNYVNNFNEKGFVFAPFNGNKIVLIPEDKSEIVNESFIFSGTKGTSNRVIAQNDNDQNIHEGLVQKGIDAIENNLFSKVVLSRKETVELKEFDLVSIFKKLLNTYPTAFTYCWYHPEIGLWLGAFSEQLLKVNGNVFHTMALAGTQKFQDSEDVIWQEKEKQEQQFVTDFILDKLKDSVAEIEISEPYTLKAGNLLHIKTDIQGILKDDFNIKQLVEILHPTPAVCGLPKDIARQFILENENYDREYYSGFLGEFNKDFRTNRNDTDLFVNLRCMQIKIGENASAKALLYIGGGITKESIPEKEWIETVNKSMTMKQILEA